MGLYGAVVVDADATGCPSGLAAYPGVCYDRDIVVIYSEVDTDLRIAQGAAQALNFKPKFFLVNGDPTGSSVLTGTAPADLNSRVLLRFVNAGLKSYVPTLLGEDLEWVAEYGNPYPHIRRSYSAMLSAGKTMDAIWTPLTYDRHALYDRRLHMTHNGYPGGGLRAFLDSADDTLPVADAGPDQIHVAMATGTIQLTGSSTTAGVSYQWALVGFPSGSSAALSDTTIADPTFTLDVPGTYTAQLVVSAGGLSSAADSVSVFTNLPPVAVAMADALVDLGDNVTLDGSASYDPDSVDTIQSYEWHVTAPDATTFDLTGAMSSFVANQVGYYTVDLTASDGELSGTDTTTSMASVHVAQPPDALDDFFEVLQWKRNNDNYTPNTLFVLINDRDPDGSIVESSLSIVTEPMNRASAVPFFDTTSGHWAVEYIPKRGFKGTDFFTYSICDDEGACSEAQVLVNVIKVRNR